MALSFSGLEPVKFGGKICTPKINTELKLRLSQLRRLDDEGDDILASAFPEDEAYVRDFLKNRMTILEKQTLQAYLLGSEQAVSLLREKMLNSKVGEQNG